MASYHDETLPSGTNAKAAWLRVQDLMVGNYSVEVLPQPAQNTVVLRVWFDEHCKASTHTSV